MNVLLKLAVSSPAAGYEYYTYIIIFFLYFLRQYLGLRSCISSIICYRLNTSARKKRRKNQSFKEWFLYTRYRDVVPKFFLIWYFVRIGVYIAANLMMVIFWITGIEKEYIRKMLWGFTIIYGIEAIVLSCLFGFRIYQNDEKKISRWLDRKKRNRK